MKVDRSLGKDIDATAREARALEAAGYDAIWTGETKHDPFLQMLVAAQNTERSLIGTAIAIAFARTPMLLANAGHDLQRYSRGRFVLGLGSQVKPHIERRFSMPWSHPAARMRELILAMRAIWGCWLNGTKLDFQGEFYTHTLMTPFFSPEPHEWGAPKVFLAGVNERMTEVAGEVCDGFLFHPFTTPRYLREVTVPALARGRKNAGLDSLDDLEICGPAFATIGRDDEELAAAIAGTKNQIAFYASTPAYRTVLELHGWGDLQPELTSLTKQGRWKDMAALIDDDILHEFSVVGRPVDVAAGLVSRFGDVATRLTLYTTYAIDDEVAAEVSRLVRLAGASST